MGGKAWAESEIDFVKRNYQSLTWKQIGQQLQRTPKAVGHLAKQIGLSKEPVGAWSEADLQFVRDKIDDYTHSEIAQRLGRSLDSVRNCCRNYHIHEKEIQPGDIFNRWTVLTPKYYKWANDQNNGMVMARCQCGVEQEVMLNRIKSGQSKSCGCLNAELASQRMTQ